MYIIFIRSIYICCGFQVSEFQVSGNLETSGNQRKPGNNLHVLLMLDLRDLPFTASLVKFHPGSPAFPAFADGVPTSV